MRVSVFTKVEGMVVMESATSLVKPEVAEEGILETERVKLSGLSAVQVREKDALGSMLYLLSSPSSTLSEELRESMGGAVRSVVNSREPAGEEAVKRQVFGGFRIWLHNPHAMYKLVVQYFYPTYSYCGKWYYIKAPGASAETLCSTLHLTANTVQ